MLLAKFTKQIFCQISGNEIDLIGKIAYLYLMLLLKTKKSKSTDTLVRINDALKKKI